MADNYAFMIVLSVIMVVVVVAELIYLRNRRLKKATGGVGSSKMGKATLRDEAHNALITGRAIARTLERSGATLSGAWSQLEEAQIAFDRGNYRVTIDLVDRAKESMKTARLAMEKRGDVAKLESSTPAPEQEETLTKEFIQKKLPENFMQAKFSINLARDQIEECRSRGVGIGGAQAVLADAERAFQEKEYARALSLAMQCKNMTGTTPSGIESIPREEEVIEITEEQLKNRCAGCGEFLVLGDSFCRKCGAKIPKAMKCDSCGKVAEIDDRFCRGCGTKLPS